ncbi:MAG: VWA domain-containing protein [Rhodospirillaceae bacterium]
MTSAPSSQNPEEQESLPPGLALLERLEGSKLVPNIMHFGRVLRTAGLPVGPGKILDAVKATQAVGIASRRDFYWALHAVFVNRRDQHEVFDQAFHIFWRDPHLLERMLGLVMPFQGDEEEGPPPEPPSRRVAEAMSSGEEPKRPEEEKEPEIDVEATLTASANELLQKMDFEDMSADEMAQAKALISRMRLPIQDIPIRRFRRSNRPGKVDMRGTLRAALRNGGAVIPLQYRKRKTRTPPLVILCDISGSMGRYTRMVLHFMHAITNDRDRVHTFLFGTRLTNVTRHLRQKDIDLALDSCVDAVDDWSGGTRIGECLKDFNQFWSRRVLGQGAMMILISDGLDRDAGRGLSSEMERLHKSCRRLIWLNPLLRFDGFEPKSQGIRAILPHVDEFRQVHNLESLTQLVEALNRQMQRRQEEMSQWREAM